jgi:hypothetical protein|tara:strand:+ start:4902 stop:5411 length:510 start_codon:yes stop_codon:yes gene_type:complete
MAKCRTCATKRPSQVAGFQDVPYTEVAAAVVTSYAAGKVDTMLTTESDGTAKTGFLVDNPMARNGLFLAAGVGVLAYLKGEMYKGAGIGLATYGGYQLIQGLMTPKDATVTGLRWVPPTNIAGLNDGLRTLPGNYGVAPDLVAGYQGSNYAQEEFEESQMAVSGLTRAL